MRLSVEIIFVYNILRVLGWIQIIIFLIYQTSIELAETNTIANLVRLLTGAKLFEILFIKPQEIFQQHNILKYLIYSTKLLLLYYLMFPDICFCSFRNTISGWAIQEILESFYHLGKSSSMQQIKNQLQYILIPYTSLGIIRIINRVIEKYNEDIKGLRLMQVFIVFLSAYHIYVNYKTKSKQNSRKITSQKSF